MKKSGDSIERVGLAAGERLKTIQQDPEHQAAKIKIESSIQPGELSSFTGGAGGLPCPWAATGCQHSPRYLNSAQRGGGGEGWHLGVGVALGGSQTGSEEAMTLALGLVWFQAPKCPRGRGGPSWNICNSSTLQPSRAG